MIKTCLHCGAEFEPEEHHQKFCSTNCRSKAYYAKHHPKFEPVERQCLHCGKMFTITSAHGQHQKFCSAECRNHYHYNTNPIVVKTCAFCGKEFETNRPYQIYCSETCNRAAYRLRHDRTVTKTCAYCHGEFTTRDSKKIYCSVMCRRSAERLNARLQREAQREADIQAALNKPAVVEPIEPPKPAPPKVIIPAAVAQNRKPTVDELLDWIFSKEATA